MHVRKEDEAAELCRRANDEMYAATLEYPGRFYGYASLPVDDIEAALRSWALHQRAWLCVRHV